MKRTKIINRPTRLSDMSFDDYYDSNDRQQDRVHRLQVKRWRKLKNQFI